MALVALLMLIAIGSLVKNNFFPSLNGLIILDSVEGGGICKSAVLVKNLGTEDQIILKDIIYDKDQYLGNMVSPETKCARIFYSNAFGGYTPPTQTPTTIPE